MPILTSIYFQFKVYLLFPFKNCFFYSFKNSLIVNSLFKNMENRKCTIPSNTFIPYLPLLFEEIVHTMPLLHWGIHKLHTRPILGQIGTDDFSLFNEYQKHVAHKILNLGIKIWVQNMSSSEKKQNSVTHQLSLS